MLNPTKLILAILIALFWQSSGPAPAIAQDTLSAVPLRVGAPIKLTIDGAPDALRQALIDRITEEALARGINLIGAVETEFAFRLEGRSATTAGLDGTSVMILWLLSRADGAPVGSFTTEFLVENRAPNNPWDVANADMINQIARETVQVVYNLAPVSVPPLEATGLIATPQPSTSNIAVPREKPVQGTELATLSGGIQSDREITGSEVVAVPPPSPPQPRFTSKPEETVRHAAPIKPVDVAAPTPVIDQSVSATAPQQPIDIALPRERPASVPRQEPVIVTTVEPSDKATPILVGIVEGAPSDGDRLLAEALHEELRDQGLPMVGESSKRWYTISANVTSTPKDDKENIVILWTVTNALGSELGQVRQENTVTPGSLESSWGDNARLAARSAAGGILILLRQAGESY